MIGASPMVMPMLIVIWKSSIDTTPAATRLPNVERDFVITLRPRHRSSA